MKHGSLYNGIGGFQLAAQWMGWENIFSCEIDEWCNKVTKKHFPDCIQHGDITKTDFTIYRRNIDILTGGFPCQTFSVAGKGECDLTLWKEMCRAVREISPRFVLAENVPGLVTQQGGMAFKTVCSDLENIGYEITPLNIPAASKGAPHKRERIWIVAHSGSKHSNISIQQRGQDKTENTNADWVNSENVSNSASEGLQKSKARIEYFSLRHVKRTDREINSDTKSIGLQRSIETNGSEGQKRNDKLSYGCNREWEQSAVEVATRLCRMDARIPDRIHRIKALGNSIVPQIAFEIFKAIQEIKP